jgi:DNA-binding NarL/FixJ family response regulator
MLEQNSKPFFILTDLNTAEMGALEFLRAVKADDILSQIPVIILSGFCSEEDVIDSFKLGAAGYMVKPDDYKKLVEIVSTIHKYWTLSKSPNLSLDSRLDHPASPRTAVKQ